MEYLKIIGISCAAISIYHFIVSRKYRDELMNKIEIHLRLIGAISRENRSIIRILRDNIRTQGHILDRIEDLEDDIYLDETDSENCDDENVAVPESNATNEV